jgi:hypothetical protein
VETTSAAAEPTPPPAALVPAPSAEPHAILGLAPLPDALLAPSAGVGPAPASPSTAAVTSTEAPATVAAAPVSAGAPTPLQEAFAALREVVRGATGPDKPFAGAASVKTRLARHLGSFDERTLGFGKFKDFLVAAEQGGFVRVESSGPATRVRLPDGG